MNKLFPLYSLASLDYFRLFTKQNLAEIALAEYYVKQSLRNRFYIMGANNILLLSIPVKNDFRAKTISEIKIDYSENVMIKNWRGIEASYRKSPYFEHYSEYFYKLFSARHYLLAEFNIEALLLILKILKCKTKIELNTLPTNEIRKIKPYNNYNKYNQVFADRHGFVPNLSILDLIFNMGPYSVEYLG